MLPKRQIAQCQFGGWPTLSQIPKMGLPHPSRVFLREGWAAAPTTICRNAHQTSPVPRTGLPAFHNVQLLSPDAAARYVSGERDLRGRTRARLVRLLHHGLCRDAGARAPATRRTGTLEIVRDDTDAQADHVTKSPSETSSAFLAGPAITIFRYGPKRNASRSRATYIAIR